MKTQFWGPVCLLQDQQQEHQIITLFIPKEAIYTAS